MLSIKYKITQKVGFKKLCKDLHQQFYIKCFSGKLFLMSNMIPYKIRSLVFLCLLAVLMCINYVSANAETKTLLDAKNLFIEGNWLDAAKLAKKEGSGEGYALAAQITCYYGRFLASDENKEKLFTQAMKLAEKGVELAPKSSFAHLQVAHAMGRYSQTVGILEALTEGYADQILDSVNQAIKLNPNYSRAYVLLGNWHAEIINSAGFMGRMIYGASESEALAAYNKAVQLDPDSLLIRIEYASGLLKLDEDSYHQLALANLAEAISISPKNSLEKILLKKAKEMQSTLKN
jgi:tetratricopeptide (TPR) repeat protein